MHYYFIAQLDDERKIRLDSLTPSPLYPDTQNSPWPCQKCPLLFTFQLQTAAAEPVEGRTADTFHKSAMILFFSSDESVGRE